MIELHGYIDEHGNKRFADWLDRLDAVAAAKVTIALARMEEGNFSKVKGVGSGVFEYKIDFGPGYRIYFGRDGESIVILIGGGTNQTDSYECLSSAELLDPATKKWNPAADLAQGRCYASATRLKDGRVLVAGGVDQRLPPAFASAEIYDPKSKDWKAAAPMKRARYLHSATLLDSGLVLVAGGTAERTLKQAELYNPETDTWSDAAAMGDVRMNHTATLLPNGEVLVAGESAELYGPRFNGGCDPRAVACPAPEGDEAGAAGAGGDAGSSGGAGSIGGAASHATEGHSGTAAGGTPSSAVAGGPDVGVGGVASDGVGDETNPAVAGRPNAAVVGEPNVAVGGAGVGAGATQPNDTGCTCQQAGSRPGASWWSGLALGLCLFRRSRRPASRKGVR